MQMSGEGVRGGGGRSAGAGPEPAPSGGWRAPAGEWRVCIRVSVRIAPLPGRWSLELGGVLPGTPLAGSPHPGPEAQSLRSSGGAGGVGWGTPTSLFPPRLRVTSTLGVTFSESPDPPLPPSPLLPIAGITLSKQESRL